MSTLKNPPIFQWRIGIKELFRITFMCPTNVAVNVSNNTKKINSLIGIFINWAISCLLSILQYGLTLLKSYFLDRGYR